MGLFDEIAIKNSIRKLNNAKDDLNNDYSPIRQYNDHIDSVISDFQSFVGNRGVAAVIEVKLGACKEAYQYNDGYLTTASNYIQNEINHLKSKL